MFQLFVILLFCTVLFTFLYFNKPSTETTEEVEEKYILKRTTKDGVCNPKTNAVVGYVLQDPELGESFKIMYDSPKFKGRVACFSTSKVMTVTPTGFITESGNHYNLQKINSSTGLPYYKHESKPIDMAMWSI